MTEPNNAMYHMLQARAAMARVVEAGKRWCRSFDRGEFDEAAIALELMTEAWNDVAKHFKVAGGAFEE